MLVEELRQQAAGPFRLPITIDRDTDGETVQSFLGKIGDVGTVGIAAKRLDRAGLQSVAPQVASGGQGRLAGGVQRSIARQAHPVAHLLRFGLRQGRFVQHQKTGNGYRHDHQGTADKHAPALQRCLEALLVAVADPVENRSEAGDGGTALFPFSELHHQHREDHQRHQQRGEQADRERPRLVLEERPLEAADEDQRKEHRDGGEGGGGDRQGDLFGAAGSRFKYVFFQRSVAVDVLEHDDGVVDQQADRQGKPAQRDDIEVDAAGVHHKKGEEDADRDGDPDGEGSAQVIQKDEQHDKRQNRPVD